MEEGTFDGRDTDNMKRLERKVREVMKKWKRSGGSIYWVRESVGKFEDEIVEGSGSEKL